VSNSPKNNPQMLPHLGGQSDQKGHQLIQESLNLQCEEQPETTGAALRDQAFLLLKSATPRAEQALIRSALERGFQIIGEGRAEEALAAVGFVWPESAAPRAHGPIVRGIAKDGLIRSVRLERSTGARAHCGPANRWRWVRPKDTADS
jgi:ATP-dependent DNA ligase